jgi:hypothetical protein
VKVLVVWFAAALLPLNALAEQSDATHQRPWEIELYVGGVTAGGSVDGSGQLPPAGPVFVDSFQGMSRSIPTFPSWYFGAGAAYLNAGLSGRGLRIDPLDPVLTTASAVRAGSGVVGLRLSRRLVGRTGIEIAAEHSPGGFAFTRDAQDRIEAAHASFVTLFTGLSSPFTTFSATSAASVRDGGSITAITGAVAIDLRSRGRVIPFALAGVGVASRAGHDPSISVTGRYVAELGQLFRVGIAQGDNVEIRYALPKHRPIGIVGGGVRYAMSRRLTARVDARAAVLRDRLTITVDTMPATGSTTPTGGGSFLIFSSSPPFSLDFSTNPNGNNSLRGPALNDVVTFSGSAIQTRFSLTAGVGWRF